MLGRLAVQTEYSEDLVPLNTCINHHHHCVASLQPARGIYSVKSWKGAHSEHNSLQKQNVLL